MSETDRPQLPRAQTSELNGELSSTAAFKALDATSYDAVSGSFDRFTDRYSTPIARRMVDLAGIAGEQNVLDIGAGTGVVALEAARRIEGGGRVLGVDLSDGMLRVAREKADAAGLSERLEFRRMDAEALELEDASFSALVSLFALLHFPQPEKALGEMLRVLEPGARAVIGVGTGPPRLSLSGIFDGFERVGALFQQKLGRRLEAPHHLNALLHRHLGHAREPGETTLASARHLRTAAVPRLVREAGFREVRTVWRGYRAELESAEEFWELQATFSSVARKKLRGAPPEKIEGIRHEFLESCETVLERGGRLIYRYAALLVCAVRP